MLQGECNKDERKGVPEVACGRKTAGILLAAMPCLQLLGCIACAT